jgi:hypothetical protein
MQDVDAVGTGQSSEHWMGDALAGRDKLVRQGDLSSKRPSKCRCSGNGMLVTAIATERSLSVHGGVTAPWRDCRRGGD